MNELLRGIAASAVDELTTVGPDQVARRYRFSADFAGFAGHFPGYRILPAIVQLQCLACLAGEHTGTPLRLAAVEDAKFLIPIRPDQEILVQYRLRIGAGKSLYDARLIVADKLAATFLVELVRAGGGA